MLLLQAEYVAMKPRFVSMWWGGRARTGQTITLISMMDRKKL